MLNNDNVLALHKASQNRDQKRSVRNHITLCLLLHLGCRVTELISLNVMDYHPNEGVHIRGKGIKDRFLPLEADLHKDMQTYLNHVRNELLADSTQALLINDRGHRQAVWIFGDGLRPGLKKQALKNGFTSSVAT